MGDFWDRKTRLNIQLDDLWSGVFKLTGHKKVALRICEEDVRTCKTLVVNSNITIVGKALSNGADPSEPIWQLKRIISVGGVTTEEFAGSEGDPYTYGSYTFVFNDWETAFPPLPLLNDYSLQTDGLDEYIQVPFDAALDFDAQAVPFTISVWHKRTQPPGSFGAIFSNVLAANPALTGHVIFADDNVISLLVINDNQVGSLINQTFAGITDQLWHHYCLTFDGNGNSAGIKFYIDGVYQPPVGNIDALVGPTASGGPWCFGVGAGDFVLFPTQGNFDEPSIWSVELTAAQVLSIYNAGKPTNLIVNSIVTQNPTAMPLNLSCGDGDTHPALTNKGQLGATLDSTNINGEASDFVLDVP